MKRDEIDILIKSLPYIKKYKGKVFLVKIGGSVLHKCGYDLFAEDINLLDEVEIKPLIVHGGGPQVDEISRKLGYKPRRLDGERITDREALDIAKMVFSGKVNIEFLSALRKYGSKGVGLSGVDGNIIYAKKKENIHIRDTKTGKTEIIDYGYVGDVVDTNTELLRNLLEGGYIPVISSLGSDDKGNIYNINADVIASSIAVGLGADKLINMTNVPGILRNPENKNSLISYLDSDEAERLFEEGVIVGSMIPKVRSCIYAIKQGVKRTHIIDGTQDHALLLEIFRTEGFGTMIASKKEIEKYKQEEISENDLP